MSKDVDTSWTRIKAKVCVLLKEVLQKESGRRLSYIYSRCKYMELF
jgi:hypothetical protein